MGKYFTLLQLTLASNCASYVYDCGERPIFVCCAIIIIIIIIINNDNKLNIIVLGGIITKIIQHFLFFLAKQKKI